MLQIVSQDSLGPDTCVVFKRDSYRRCTRFEYKQDGGLNTGYDTFFKHTFLSIPAAERTMDDLTIK